MIDLEARGRALNEQTVVPRRPVEDVMSRAREIRLRRRLAAIATIGSLAVIAIGAAGLRAWNTTEPRVVVTEPGVTTTTVAPAELVAPPREVIAHIPKADALGGRVIVVDTATGRTLRVLHDGDDGLIDSSVAIARSRGLAFWTREDPLGGNLTSEVVQVPIAGGRPDVIASYHGDGHPDQAQRRWPLLTGISGDGTEMWLHGDTVRNLVTNTEITIPSPPLARGLMSAGTTWLRDGHTLFAVEIPIARSCTVFSLADVATTCPTGTTAATSARAPRGARAFVFDLRHPSVGWRETPAPEREAGWSDLRVVGAGRLASTVVAVAEPAPLGTGTRPRVLTIDVSSGAVLDDLEIPGDWALAVDASGTNVLFVANGHLEHLSLADPKPVVIGPEVAEAAW